MHSYFRFLLLSLVFSSTGCTLEFDRFSEPADALPDMSPVDQGVEVDAIVDMQVLAPDMPVMATDTDDDGIPDEEDNCLDVANPDQADLDGDGIGDVCDEDADGDDVRDEVDVCPGLPNPLQLDLDEDGLGDECDDDIDGDDLDNDTEEALGTDPAEPDTDFDGKLDSLDECPVTADRWGIDSDADGFGDACDQDDDNDGVFDWADNCPGTENADQAYGLLDADDDGEPEPGAPDGRGDACIGDLDGDGVSDDVDTCVYVANPEQSQRPCGTYFEGLTLIQGVRDMAIDGDEEMLAATAGGLLQFNAGADNFVDISRADISVTTNVQGLSDLDISGVYWEPRPDEGEPEVRVLRAWVTTGNGLAIVRSDGFVFNFHQTDLEAGPVGATTVVATGQNSIWVGSDQGLNRLTAEGWSLLGSDVIGEGEVKALWMDELRRLWVVTTAGVTRIVEGMPQSPLEGLPEELGEFLNIGALPSGEIMLLAEEGVVILNQDEDLMVTPGGIYLGFRAQDLVAGQADSYIASSTGLRRLDSDGRIYPAGALPFPSADLQTAIDGGAGDIWLGTPRGMARARSYFATYGRPTVPACVKTARRVDENIWYGGCTDDTCADPESGLYVFGSDNESIRIEDAALPGADGAPSDRIINQILPVGNDRVWVATTSGIAILTRSGEPVRLLEDEPFSVGVTDMVQSAADQVWVGTNGNGLVAVDPESFETEIFTEDPANQTLLSNFVSALAYGGGQLWIGSVEGISVYVPGEGAYRPPLTEARLPSVQINDLTFSATGDAQRFHVATERGLVSCVPDGVCLTVNRAGIRPALPGIPHAAGTDNVLSLSFDGEHLWLAMGVAQLQPFGSLVRMSPNPSPTPEEAPTLLFDAENHDLPQTNAFGGVNIDFVGDELMLSMCGDGDQPGGLSILAARNVITNNPGLLGLRGQGRSAVLTTDVNGNALVGGLSEGNPAAQIVENDGGLTDFELPPVFSEPLTRCARSSDPVSTKLWCIFGREGFATRQQANPWIPTASMNLRYLRDRELTDIVVIGDGEAWMGTSDGLVRFSGANSEIYRVDSPGGGPGNNLIRRLHLDGDQLYVATEGGADVVDLSGLNAGEEMVWRPLDLADRRGAVKSIRTSPDGTLWIGFDSGLTAISADGEQRTHFRSGDGLPSNRINDIFALESHRVLVATDGGLGVLEYGCVNGIDDDGDDLIDLDDPGCVDGTDPSEAEDGVDVPQCANEQDDDGDGLIDFPDEPGCTSAGDNDEADPEEDAACNNGVDDDEDGLTDFPEDDGCVGLGAGSEVRPTFWNQPHRFTPLGFNDGLPGTAAYEIHRTNRGDIWVRSEHGMGRLLEAP